MPIPLIALTTWMRLNDSLKKKKIVGEISQARGFHPVGERAPISTRYSSTASEVAACECCQMIAHSQKKSPGG